MSEMIAVDPARRWRQEWRRLPSTMSSVRSVRSGLRAFLDGSGVRPDDLHDLEVATCEAAINAIEHARHPTEPWFDVSFEIDERRVTVVVRDYGQWRDGPVDPRRGRGLMMMSALADTTVHIRPQGTTVTIRSPLGAVPPSGLA